MKTFAFLFVACIFGIIFEGGKAQECGIGSAGALFANYFKDIFETERIIGGQALKDGAFPWIVYISIIHDGGKTGGCTGTVISPNYILTAKHCTAFESLESIEIFYGSSNRRRMVSQKFSAAFNSPGLDDVGEDIALIKLQTPIVYSENVNPICLSRNLRPKIGDKTIVAGFGYVFNEVLNGAKEGDEVEETGMNVNTPDELNAVKVDIVEDNICTCHCNVPEEIAVGIQSDKEICAGGLQEGTMEGDSGGPLMILDKNSNLWYQVGVTARGQAYATNNTKQIVDH
uniref:Peptidase S1 domain-containing protein n=1 Tax=Panagrolaimus sp. ES5 TaxID=591445 RepID=A0AC34G6S2_9BILA